MSAVHDLLVRVRERLSNPERWCQLHAAVRMDGEPVDALDGQACAWCLTGALDAEGAGKGFLPISDAQRALVAAIPPGATSHWVEPGNHIVQFNDNGTWQEVLDLLDRAIAATP